VPSAIAANKRFEIDRPTTVQNEPIFGRIQVFWGYAAWYTASLPA
jgi:hypothetical protein